MNSIKYLNALLTAIAMLLLGILLVLLSDREPGFSLPRSAFAQTESSTNTLVFHPWINPRKYIFWDPQKREVYIYDEDGDIEATWAVGKMGEELKKMKKVF